MNKIKGFFSRISNYTKSLINRIKDFTNIYLEEILILSGLILIVIATSFISYVAAIYVAGIMLLSMGVFLSIMTRRG